MQILRPEDQKIISMTFRETIKGIKDIYVDRIEDLKGKNRIKSQEFKRQQQHIENLKQIIEEKDRTIAESSIKMAQMEKSLVDKQKYIEEVSIRYEQLKRQKANSELTHQDSLAKLNISFKQQKQQMEDKLELLSKQIQKREKQLEQQRNNDAFSINASSISHLSQVGSTSFSFANELSLIFRNYPEKILEFLASVPGEKPESKDEAGGMTCMFISKDNVAVQKFVEINRNFLKRKIKEYEKKFRFVLIYRPVLS